MPLICIGSFARAWQIAWRLRGGGDDAASNGERTRMWQVRQPATGLMCMPEQSLCCERIRGQGKRYATVCHGDTGHGGTDEPSRGRLSTGESCPWPATSPLGSSQDASWKRPGRSQLVARACGRAEEGRCPGMCLGVCPRCRFCDLSRSQAATETRMTLFICLHLVLASACQRERECGSLVFASWLLCCQLLPRNLDSRHPRR